MIIGKIGKFTQRIMNIAFHRTTNLHLVRLLPRPTTLFIKKTLGDKPLVGAEVGVFQGQNSQSIIRTLNMRKLYLVDPYATYDAYRNSLLYGEIDKAYRKSRRRLNPYKKKVIWVREYSEKGLKKIKETLDFVYIDGNHDYEYVKKDIELSLPLVREGGIIGGHDIDDERVARAVVEMINKYGFKIHIEGSDWFFIKTSNGKEEDSK